MNTRFTLIAVAGAVALASCANQPEAHKVPVSTSVNPKSSASEQIYQEVNSYRASRGAAGLKRHAGLDRLAQEHCEYLRKNRGSFSLNGRNVSHIGFDGRALVARERYNMANVSENVAAAKHPGSGASRSIIDLWKNSSSHHKNMIDDWQFTGVGVVVDSDGMVFSTQLFANEGVGRMLTRTRFTSF